ncbi:MAG: HAMP domain-containing protein [Anaerolineae bacterium]|nr:HAMP domain-containing protein [Anaerolineae bacterium]
MFERIRWRIAIPYMLMILAGMTLMVIYLSDLVRSAYLDRLQDQLIAEAKLIGDALQPLLPQDLPAKAYDPLAYRYARLLDARITIIDPDGVIIGESHMSRIQMDNHLNRPEVQQALSAGQGSSIRFSETVGYDMMYAAVSVTTGEQLVNPTSGTVLGIIRVSLPLSEVTAQVNRLQRAVLLAALIATLMVAVLAAIIAERITKPIRRLTQVAEQVAEGDLSARLLPTTRDEIGKLTQVFNRMADQLDEKITTLAQEQSRLSAVLDNMAGGAIIIDQSERVRLINPAAARLLDIPPQEALGLSVTQVVRHHQLVDLWQRCRDQGQEQSATVEIGRQNLFLQAIARPFQAADTRGYLFILQDLTRIRRLETIRRDFISNISHELRTPLAGLKALVDTLRYGAMEDPPAAQRFLDRMEIEVDALTQMVEELLELSRIESGKMPLRLAPVAVSDLILLPVERLEPQADRANLSVDVDPLSDLPLVLAERERIQQVVTNLVHNAIKFTPSGGRVRISAQVDGENLVISVRDTGVGILPDDLPRIFERFYKADRARSGGGTGLGLAIAKHIVQIHGGRIWAESPWIDPDTGERIQGSTFHFSLQLAN